MPTIEQIRAEFPALGSETVFFENAGGSQVPRVVADAMRDFMLTRYVQLGAGYRTSIEATETIDAARAFLALYINAGSMGRVMFSPSSSQTCRSLAEAYAGALAPGDEIVAAQTGHEANVGPWFRLAQRGFKVKMWPVNRDSMRCEIEQLEHLLTGRTRIIAFPHTSNLLGDIVDARRIADIAHSVGAKVVVDGVAYAPHRAIDVQAIDADWYVYSTYKVFGPHMAVLFGKHEAMDELAGPGHFFFPTGSSSKWELGCVNYEGCAGIFALSKYLGFVAGESGEVSRGTIGAAWSYMSALELPLQGMLMRYLQSKNGVRIIGPAQSDASRVGIVSFVSDRASCPEIVEATDREQIGIRYGHAYAVRLCEGLGLDSGTGVVRVSFSHYNTIEEVERLIEVLDKVL